MQLFMNSTSKYCPVANVVHLVFLYQVFLAVSESFLSADSKSEDSQTKYVERFSKNRYIQNGRIVDDKQYCMMHSIFDIVYIYLCFNWYTYCPLVDNSSQLVC